MLPQLNSSNNPQAQQGTGPQYTPNKTINLIAIVTAGLVFMLALGSFTLSYSALKDYAQQHGISDNLSYVWPLLVDASLIVFSLSVVNAYLQSESTKKQWALVAIYTIATIAFNVLHAPGNIQAQIVAAIAPISLFFSFELLMSQLKTGVKKQGIAQNIKQLQADLQERASTIAKMDATIERKQVQLAALTANINDAKSSKNSDFANKMQDKRQQKIAERRQNVLQLLQQGLDEKQIAMQVGVKDVRTIRNDIAALNGQVTQ